MVKFLDDADENLQGVNTGKSLKRRKSLLNKESVDWCMSSKVTPKKDTRTDAQKMTDATGPRPGSNPLQRVTDACSIKSTTEILWDSSCHPKG